MWWVAAFGIIAAGAVACKLIERWHDKRVAQMQADYDAWEAALRSAVDKGDADEVARIAGKDWRGFAAVVN